MSDDPRTKQESGSQFAGRKPTQKQYEILLMLGNGNAWLSATKGRCEPLLRRGWVTADWRPPYYQFVRITPDGLRALAVAVETFGLPELKPSEQRTQVRVCAECGSGRYRFKEISADEYIALGRP